MSMIRPVYEMNEELGIFVIKEKPVYWGQLVFDAAKKEVGVREVPRNSNLGPRVEEYQRAVGSWAVGGQWCASFVSAICKWTATENNLVNRTPVNSGVSNLWRLSNSRGLKLFLPQDLIDGKETLLPGDIFIMTASNAKGEIARLRAFEEGFRTPSHTGFCDGTWDAATQTFGTVEGNTNVAGSRTGGGVYARSRRLRENMVGFIRPKAERK